MDFCRNFGKIKQFKITSKLQMLLQFCMFRTANPTCHRNPRSRKQPCWRSPGWQCVGHACNQSQRSSRGARPVAYVHPISVRTPQVRQLSGTRVLGWMINRSQISQPRTNSSALIDIHKIDTLLNHSELKSFRFSQNLKLCTFAKFQFPDKSSTSEV